MPKVRTLLLLLAFLACSSARPANLESVLAYHLDITDRSVRVSIRVPAGPDTATFEMDQWAGVPDFPLNMYRVEAQSSDGKPLKVERPDDHTWKVLTDRAPFELSYLVVSSKDSHRGDGRFDKFYPTLLRDLVHIWGHSVFLFPADSSLREHRFVLDIDAHEYGVATSTFEIGSIDQLLDALIIAGDYRRIDAEVASVPLHFFIAGGYSFSDSEFTGAVTRIIGDQANYFGSYPASQLIIALNQGRDDSYGGTVVDNGISLFIGPNDSLFAADLASLRLIAHENMHVWIGRHYRAASNQYDEGHFKWFTEGMPEYYSYLTMLRLGYMSSTHFLQEMNKLIVTYYKNPHAFTATADTLEGRIYVSHDYNRLAYDKGALLGFLIDLEINGASDGKQSIDDLILSLPDAASEEYSDEHLRSALEDLTRTDWSDAYASLMLGADTVPVGRYAELLGARLTRDTVPVFDLGFSTVDGRIGPGAIIRAVAVGSTAEQAGLHPDDTIAGNSIYLDDPSRDATIWIRAGKSDKKLTYRPSRQMLVPQLAQTDSVLAIVNRLARH